MAAKSKQLNGKLDPTDFGTDLSAYLAALRRKGQPITLSINGKGALAVSDDESLRKLAHLVDRLETIVDIEEAIDDFENGRSYPAEQVFREIREEFGLPLKS